MICATLSSSKIVRARTSSAAHSAADWRLMLSVLGLLVRVRVGLTFSSLKAVQGWLPTEPARANTGISPERIARYVRRGARLVPGASCLTQALTCQTLLHRNGVASTIKLGVRRQGDDLAAHAWVVVDERVALGGTPATLREFAQIVQFGPIRR
jgi:hypothetical protein